MIILNASIMTGTFPLLSRFDGPDAQKSGISDPISQLRIVLSADGNLTIASVQPQPGPASIEKPLRLPQGDPVSQLYPSNLSAIADPVRGAAYLRWRVFVSLKKVTPSLFTKHKTSNREVYNNAMAALPAQSRELVTNHVQLQTDVLIVNNSNEIMESCRFTPYFMRGNRWITPEAGCGGNLGTTRRWAVEKGLCELGVIKSDSVKCGEIIVLSNGGQGFQSGIVKSWESLSNDDTKQ